MKISRFSIELGFAIIALFVFTPQILHAQNLPDTIEKIKPSIVAIGTFQKTRRPPAVFRGTGFVVGDGLHVATNAHVLLDKIDKERKETLAIFTGKADQIEVREATQVAEDRDHDLFCSKFPADRCRL